MRATCTRQLLTVRKVVLWAVKSEAVGKGKQRNKSDLDPFVVYSEQQDQSVRKCLILWFVKCETLTFHYTHRANQCISLLKCQNAVPKCIIPPAFINREQMVDILCLGFYSVLPVTVQFSSENINMWHLPVFAKIHFFALITVIFTRIIPAGLNYSSRYTSYIFEAGAVLVEYFIIITIIIYYLSFFDVAQWCRNREKSPNRCTTSANESRSHNNLRMALLIVLMYLIVLQLMRLAPPGEKGIIQPWSVSVVFP